MCPKQKLKLLTNKKQSQGVMVGMKQKICGALFPAYCCFFKKNMNESSDFLKKAYFEKIVKIFAIIMIIKTIAIITRMLLLIIMTVIMTVNNNIITLKILLKIAG